MNDVDLSEKDWDDVMHANIKSAFFIGRPWQIANGGGKDIRVACGRSAQCEDSRMHSGGGAQRALCAGQPSFRRASEGLPPAQLKPSSDLFE